MDRRKQDSVINTVNNIVNPQETNVFGVEITEALDVFEVLFDYQLSLDEESQLIDVGIDFITNGGEPTKVNLNEDVEVLMDKYNPEEVFVALLEKRSKKQHVINPDQKVIEISDPIDDKTKKSDDTTDDDTSLASPWGKQGQLRTLAQQTINPALNVPEYGQQTQQLMEIRSEDLPPRKEGESLSDYRFRITAMQAGRISREAEQGRIARGIPTTPRRKGRKIRIIDNRGDIMESFLPNKKKKKVFKIIFVDKGVKKKGTAVSHKGVARIVSGKKVFKVFDEHNRDVTAQFKHGKSHAKKTDKK